MKPIHALIVAVLAGAGTFELQNAILPPEAHAAGFRVPTGPDWRQQMIMRDPGVTGIDRSLDRLSRHLSLTPEQAKKIRPLLQQRHDRVLALLLTGPGTLTLDEFMADRHKFSIEMHDHVDALLTNDQLELAREFRSSAQV
jgi:hypothetical protein